MKWWGFLGSKCIGRREKCLVHRGTLSVAWRRASFKGDWEEVKRGRKENQEYGKAKGTVLGYNNVVFIV